MIRIYVGNLPPTLTDAQLHQLASSYGKPQAASIAKKLAGGVSKGFGFIEYATDAEGRAAIAALDRKKIDGQTLSVFAAKELAVRPWSAKRRG